MQDNQKNLLARIIAFYLPQFHPIPENDKWWGKGFTEWTNVTKTKPLFRRHYQPRLPADLGFYDLRLSEVREAQADLAHQYGIEGFCYWHYWFKGQRLLNQPLDEMLHLGKPDFSFCLAWANEPWSRRWLGEERDILMVQEHSPEDDRNHSYWLLTALSDSRYLQIHGRPLLLIYRPTFLPEPRQTTDVIRETCINAGLPEPFLLGIDAHCPGTDCRSIGFDGTLKFEPQLGVLPEAFVDRPSWRKFRYNLKQSIWSASLKTYDYEEARYLMNQNHLTFPFYPSIFVGWDNTPRRGANGVIVLNNHPELFGKGLFQLVESSLEKPLEDRLIFINAWNEWAEGNYLEPDQRFGHRYLKATRNALGLLKCSARD